VSLDMGGLRFELRTNRLKAETMRLETPWHHWAYRLGPQTTPKQQGERRGALCLLVWLHLVFMAPPSRHAPQPLHPQH
jgi:hypothetical protein